MQTVDAVFTGRKFELLGPVTLAENDRVRLKVEAIPASEPLSVDEVYKRIEKAKSIAEWLELTKLLPTDDAGYDIEERLRENRIFSGEVVPPRIEK